MGATYDIINKIAYPKTKSQYNLTELSEEKLQEVIKFFFEDFEMKFPNFKYDSEHYNIEYLNNKNLTIPKWYYGFKSHKLDEKLRIIYPNLNLKYSGTKLQSKAIEIMLKCYPFVPKTSIGLIERLANS